MEEVGFCSDCHKLILLKYSYCPWCGQSLTKAPDWNDSLDKGFNKMEKQQRYNIHKKELKLLEDKVILLEKEINQILAEENR